MPTLLERISEEDLESLRWQLAGRLVGITVVFSLNRGFPHHYPPFSRPHKKRQLISGVRPQPGLLQPQQSLLRLWGAK